MLQFTGHPGDQTTAYVLFYKETQADKTENQNENIDTSSQDQMQTDNNIEQLIKCDDWLRDRKLRAAANIERKKTLGNIPEVKTAETKTPLNDKNAISKKKIENIELHQINWDCFDTSYS